MPRSLASTPLASALAVDNSTSALPSASLFGDLAEAQVLGDGLAVFAQHDEIAVPVLLLSYDTQRGITGVDPFPRTVTG